MDTLNDVQINTHNSKSSKIYIGYLSSRLRSGDPMGSELFEMSGYGLWFPKRYVGLLVDLFLKIVLLLVLFLSNIFLSEKL